MVTGEFTDVHGMNLVVHGCASDADEERRREFFDIPIKCGKFRRIQ